MFNVNGHSSVSRLMQFDMKIETGVMHLNETMRIIGVKALRTFLTSKSRLPFLHSNLIQLLNAADVKVLNESHKELESDASWCYSLEY
jgi:hypothetical protein